MRMVFAVPLGFSLRWQKGSLPGSPLSFDTVDLRHSDEQVAADIDTIDQVLADPAI